MNPQQAFEYWMRKLLALATVGMMVASLVAIANTRSEQHQRTVNVATGANAPTQGYSPGQPGTPDTSAGAATGGATNAAGTAGGAVSSDARRATGAASSGGGATGGGGRSGGGTAAAAPGACTDANPDQGVFCDHFVIGGTTVLSGPLAVYGDQGLKGGKAWIAYYNTEIAPKEGLRQAKLIWYDDNLDPNKTLQFTERLNEIDHVLYLGGVTSPEAISQYLLNAKCVSRPGRDDCPMGPDTGLPMIGDIGLSPKSYTNPMIFATAPSPELQSFTRTKTMVQAFNAKSIGVIYGVLPGVDTTKVKQSWYDAAAKYGVTLKEYREMPATDTSCDSQFQAVANAKPELIILPIPSNNFLACMRSAKAQQIQPGGSNSPWLKGWMGGSGLKIETDNCLPTCKGLYSATLFRDPDKYKTPQTQAYLANMAKYAPDVDYKGFIAINYYHDGWIFYNLTKSAGIQSNLTRKNLVDAANRFGPFDTGFGNTVTWRPVQPGQNREPTQCGYPIIATDSGWDYQDTPVCNN